MKVFLNRAEVETLGTTLTELLSEQGIKAEGIAVAINNRIIVRDMWQTTSLTEGDKITVIQATYGG